MEYWILFLSFFFKKFYTGWMKAGKWVLGTNFPYVSGFIGLIFSKTNRVHPWMDSHQPCKFHENQFKTVTCILRSHTSIYFNNYPAPLLSGQHKLESRTTNVKSAVVQITVISRNAGNESIHPMSSCITTFADTYKSMFRKNS